MRHEILSPCMVFASAGMTAKKELDSGCRMRLVDLIILHSAASAGDISHIADAGRYTLPHCSREFEASITCPPFSPHATSMYRPMAATSGDLPCFFGRTQKHGASRHWLQPL